MMFPKEFELLIRKLRRQYSHILEIKVRGAGRVEIIPLFQFKCKECRKDFKTTDMRQQYCNPTHAARFRMRKFRRLA